MRFSPDGDRLFSASHDTWVRIWDLDGNQIHAFQPTGAGDFPNEVLGIGISPDGTEVIRTLEGHPAPVWELIFSPDSSLLLSADGLETRIWRGEDGQLLYVGKNACP